MRILLVSTMRNEGPFVLEWLAHHLALGVSDALVFSNDCEDGTDALLEALAPAGITHVPMGAMGGKPVQWRALKAAWAHPLAGSADWWLGLDCDEFVNLRAPLTGLADVLDRVPQADALALKWRLFGHAGHVRRPKGITPEIYDRAAPTPLAFPVLGSFFKTLHKAGAPFTGPGVHRPKQGEGAVAWVDGAGVPLPAGFAKAQKRITLWGLETGDDLVQLNHYSVRSIEDFIIKTTRGLPNHTDKPIDLTYWVERNFNAVQDRSIAHLMPATQAKLAQLRALPRVADLEARALDWHRARFEQVMTQPETVKLFSRLVLSAGSSAPPPSLARDLVRWTQAALGGAS